MEQEKNITEEGGISLSAILHTLLRNIWLIILITVIAIGVGVVSIFTAEPNYTSTVQVAYKAENNLKPTTQNNINAMNAFVETIVDFCDEGVVLDRANFYYNGYLMEKAKENGDYNIEDYIEEIRSNDTYKAEFAGNQDQAINQSSISTKYDIGDDNNVKFSFSMSYTDKDKQASYDKIKILVFAFNSECSETIIVDNKEQGKYFQGITSEIIDLGDFGEPVSDFSVVKTLLLSAIIGIILSCVVIYIIVISDRSIKSKEELEQITGVDMLSYLVKQEN